MQTIYLMMTFYPPSDSERPDETNKVAHAAKIQYTTIQERDALILKSLAALDAWAKQKVSLLKDPT